MKRVALSLLLIAVSTLVGLAMVEGLLRLGGFQSPIWFGPDRELGWALRPHARGWHTGEGRAWVQINSAGQRDDREHAADKPHDVYRIAVLGDSYAEAMQVDVGNAFWRVLQEELSSCSFRPGMKIEVVNFGVSGYGTAQEYLALESRAAPYRPDLVLLAFTNGNDVRNNSPALESERDRPFFRLAPKGLALDDSFARTGEFRRRSSALLELDRSIADHFRVMQLVHVARNAITEWRAASGAAQAAEPGIDYAVLAPPRTRAWQDAWAVTDALVGRIAQASKAHGAALVVVPVTAAVQVDPDPAVRERTQQSLGVPDLFYIERHLDSLARSIGAREVPLAYEMQRRAQADRVYFHGFQRTGMGKGHWNERGHRAAADIVARSLCARPPH